MTPAAARRQVAIKELRKRRDNPEERFQMTVVQYLRSIPGLICFAVPNGGKRGKAEAARMKATGTLAGVPDLCIIGPNGKAYFLELKAGKNKLTSAQEELQPLLIEAGCSVANVRTLEEVAATVNLWFGPYGYRIPRVA